MSLDKWTPGPFKLPGVRPGIELMVPDGAYQVKTRNGSGDAELLGLVDDPKATNVIDVQTGSGDARVTAIPGT